MPDRKKGQKHIVLTSHPGPFGSRPSSIVWGHSEPLQPGPVIATLTEPHQRNAIGTHAGTYAVYRALAIASGALQPGHRPDLTHTAPVIPLGPHPSWGQPDTIVSLDPFGAVVCEVFADFYARGYDIRPTIAVTRAHINMPELQEAVAKGRLAVDGTILLLGGAFVGLLYGLFGVGSAFATPLLALMGVPGVIAVTAPLPGIMPGSLAGAWGYARRERVVERLGAAVERVPEAIELLVEARGDLRGLDGDAGVEIVEVVAHRAGNILCALGKTLDHLDLLKEVTIS